MQRVITDDLEALLERLPPRIGDPLRHAEDRGDLLEIVLDLGRAPEARYPGREVLLGEQEVTDEDLQYVIDRIGVFGDDNRAGIERTLHRISAIRNRKGRIVGLTCRIGRSVYGTIQIIQDLVESGRSMLLLGRPGVGKTTMLREVARVLADDLKKRVIIVDTSNEIGGDGDIPHPAIGRARRMQVVTPTKQHAVMIEAVENHMPEVIVIDEIGTELEAEAARTIAERGVQLVGTAHGNSLENIMLNPTLADLVGGIQTVTLGDDEARRRGTQKSVLERKAPPTFDVVVEIQSWDRVAVHSDVASTVDAILRGQAVMAETRELDPVTGEIRREQPSPFGRRRERIDLAPSARTGTTSRRSGNGPAPVAPRATVAPAPRRAPTPLEPADDLELADDEGEEDAARAAVAPASRLKALAPVASRRVLPFGVSKQRLDQAARELGLPVTPVDFLDEADLVITIKSYFRKRPPVLRDAEARGIPIYVLKNNTVLHIQQALANIFDLDRPIDPVEAAIQETEEAIDEVINRAASVELSPQNAYIRRLQHQMAERYHLNSRSRGKEPHRRVKIFRDWDAS